MPKLEEEKKFVESLLARSEGAKYLPLTTGAPQKQRAPVPLQMKEVLEEGREWTREHLPGLDEILAQAIIDLATGGIGIAPKGSMLRVLEESGLSKIGGRIRIVPNERRRAEMYKMMAEALRYGLRMSWEQSKGNLRKFLKYSTPTMKSLVDIGSAPPMSWVGVHLPGGAGLASPNPWEAAVHALKLMATKTARRLGRAPDEAMGKALFSSARTTQQHEYGHRLQTALDMLRVQYGRFLTEAQRAILDQLRRVPREYFADAWSYVTGPIKRSPRLRRPGMALRDMLIHSGFLDKGVRRSKDPIADFNALIADMGINPPQPAMEAIKKATKGGKFDLAAYKGQVGPDPQLQQWGDWFEGFRDLWENIPEFLMAPGAR